MHIEQIYTGCLAQGAYYIESDGEAVVIDPLRDCTAYIQKAAENGARITYILETHFHADFVSGHVDLSKKTGATIVYGPHANPQFDFHQAYDGEEFSLGKHFIRVLHTPGHTKESSCYLLLDADKKPHAVFTGDTLFIGDVGRPDLAQKSTNVTQEELAATLYNSIREKLMTLPADVLVYPAHGAGSACGKNMSSQTWDTIGGQLSTNYALRSNMTQSEFVNEVTDGLLPPPAYFPKTVSLNKREISGVSDLLKKGNIALSADVFEETATHQNALILDTRDPKQFVQGHIPKSIFIGIDGNFAPWVGSLILDPEQPLLLITPEGRAEEVIMRLARVGFDQTLGYLDGGLDSWMAAGKDVDTIKQVSAEVFADQWKESASLLDLRKPGEFDTEHIEGAVNLPLGFVNQHMDEVDSQKSYYAHCLTGYRSVIFNSIMKSRGVHHIIDVEGGFEALQKTALKRTHFECTSNPSATN